MKTLQEIMQNAPIYLNLFHDKQDIIDNFEDIDTKEYNHTWDKINIILASYGYEDYFGDAFVLYEYDGQLFEVNGSHCSCYGLEDQFVPERTSLEAIADRLINGGLGKESYSGNEFSVELKQLIGI